MDRFVAAGRPTCATGHKGSVIDCAYEQLAGGGLLLVMALKAERLVARDQHLVINGAVRIVAANAAFADRLMGEDERATHGLMAPEAGLIRRLQICRSAPHDRVAAMRLVAVRAGDFSGQNGMRVGQREFSALVQVALEASLGRVVGIDDRVRRPVGINVCASRAVTRLAADVEVVATLRDQFGMSGPSEGVNLLGMALGAGFGPDVMRAHDLRRSQHRAVGRNAGNEKDSPGAEKPHQNGIPETGRLEFRY